MASQSSDPHHGQPVLAAGTALTQAKAAMILLHGRGATAASILTLADEFAVDGFSYLAPQAADNAWYPQRFTAPIAANEPYLSSALAQIAALLAQIAAAGISAERTVLLGFSQGACLALEFAARNARHYGGVVGLSGGLIGPEGTDWEYDGVLDGTAVFLGCSNVDAHIPLARVHASAQALTRLGATVDERIYPAMGHTVNADEIAAVRGIMQQITRGIDR